MVHLVLQQPQLVLQVLLELQVLVVGMVLRVLQELMVHQEHQHLQQVLQVLPELQVLQELMVLQVLQEQTDHLVLLVLLPVLREPL